MTPRWLTRLLRRVTVPPQDRCNVIQGCPNRVVVRLYQRVHDGTRDMEETRACIEHPPQGFAENAKTICPSCGLAYWPDPFHFDCE